MSVCRYCCLLVNQSTATITHAYWGGAPFTCHKACKDAGVKQEAYDCQVIDADCNDCRHYRRGKLPPVLISIIKTRDGRLEEVRHQANVFVGGHCLKFDKPTNAYPNKWTGHECFEHRRSCGNNLTTP